MIRLMGLPAVASYPEATVTLEEDRFLIRFSGRGNEQTMGVPFQYVDEEDRETAELMLLHQLQQTGYDARRGES
jgi:hypothetical protein